MSGLIEMTDRHLGQVLVWRNDWRVRMNMYTQHEISLAEHQAWWASASRRADRRYFVYEKDGENLGFVSITDIDTTHGTASWAFFASQDAPKGTGTAMERAALRMAFVDLGLRKLCCEVLDFNARVVAFHHRNGFHIEGKLRAHKLINGQYCDVILMSAFADEWKSPSTSGGNE